jgi:hypothetical protein
MAEPTLLSRPEVVFCPSPFLAKGKFFLFFWDLAVPSSGFKLENQPAQADRRERFLTTRISIPTHHLLCSLFFPCSFPVTNEKKKSQDTHGIEGLMPAGTKTLEFSLIFSLLTGI